MLEQTLIEKKKELAIGITAVVAGVAVLIVYFQSGPDASAYARAEAAFEKWEASPQDEALYTNMREAARKVPALVEKYETAIAQNLLSTEKTDEALAMAYRSLSRVKDEIPFHSSYAETSLLIEQGSYQQALEKAVALKEQMNEVPSSLLFAHNLLRIACLHRELKNRPGEKAAWEELETFLQSHKSISDLVLGSFSEKQLDLTQYIAERKKSL